MNKYIKFSAPFVFFISLILIISFRTVPSGKLWKNYYVVCVPVNTADSTVLSAINEAGIKNQISLSGQYLPVSLNENSIEISMLKLNYSSSEYAYLNKRNAMFYDKSQAYRLYYIPGKYTSETAALIKILNNQGINCIQDSSANYPWILPFIGLLLAVMLFLFVKNKIPFAAGAVIPLLYLYCNPFYPVATASCLNLLCLFFVANLWRRKGAFTILLSRYSTPAMSAIAFLCAFSSSLLSGFIYIAGIAGAVSSLYLCYMIEDFFRIKKPFVPVYIRSAKRVSQYAGKAFMSLGLVTASVLLLIILIFITSSTSIKTSSAKLLFPGNTEIKDSSLPQFDEYYEWLWNVETYPYRSLNENYEDTKSLAFSYFEENEESGIIKEIRSEMKFDDDFKKKNFEAIDQLQFDSIEKLMKSEGIDFRGGYTATSSYNTNLFGIIMCFICLFILLFIYFFIIIRKGINK